MSKKYDQREVILRILQEEKERQEAIAELKQELHKIEEKGEMRDTRRMAEIIDELYILDPPFEETKISEPQSSKKLISRLRKLLFSSTKKVIAACIIFAIIIPTFAITAINTNLWSTAVGFTRLMWSTLMGGEIIQDNLQRDASGARVYATVEEFEAEENIKLLVPTWLPGDVEVMNITYARNFDEKMQINLRYSDEKTVLRIRLYSAIPEYTGDAKIYEKANIIFYVVEDLNMISWIYDGNLYNLTCGFNISEYTDKIIENIK